MNTSNRKILFKSEGFTYLLSQIAHFNENSKVDKTIYIYGIQRNSTEFNENLFFSIFKHDRKVLRQFLWGITIFLHFEKNTILNIDVGKNMLNCIMKSTRFKNKLIF